MEETTGKVKTNVKRAFTAVGLTSTACWLFAYLAINVFEEYAWGLFIWLPLVLGATSTLLYGYKNTLVKRKLFGLSMWTLLVFCLGLLTFAWEGIICLVMAFPIGVFFTWVGHWIGYEMLRRGGGNTSASIIVMFLSVPSLMAFESVRQDAGDLRSVTTSIEINAAPETIWNNVVAFPPLGEPTEFIFKTGIAYPIKATIQGRGRGAVRYCHFSTGSFVEPVTIWDEQRLLRFAVREQPEPMKELSFYDIHPNHLHGYWVSRQGEFRLTKLANGNTLLEGTTWYVNRIKPDLYWTVWSDHIVHTIHQRVLQHIKMQAEKQSSTGKER